ncbi:MAG: uracil-DNA glycosylase [Nitrospiraceae bacterium]|nr:uracil-DNA glycosylase [Nitrospiraceae bacterium]
MIYNTGRMDKEKELKKVADEIRECRLCKKWGTGEPVPGEGSADADVVFIGEAPGKEEAKTGRPFVGRSGRLLRSMISEIGLETEEVFITSPVKYLPLRGTPSRENILHAREHLLKQLSVIGPQIVVLLGNVACLALLDRKVEITKEHGTSVRKGGRTYFITCHPAYALRFPKGKEGLREDLGKLAQQIMKTSPR